MFLHVHIHGGHDSHRHIHEHRDIRPLKIAIVLTSTVLIVQIVGGIISNSLSLLSDAGHVFVDLASLLIAFFGLRVAARNREQHDARYTFGLRRLEILAALTNGFILLGMCIYIIIEAVQRFSTPEHVHAKEMLWVAIIGFVANAVSAVFLHKSEHITTRSAYLHVLTDLMSSVGVIIGAILMLFTNWEWVDPAMSVAISALIIRGAIRVIREASIILMESAPEGVDLDKLSADVMTIDGVVNVHDLHVWQLGQNDFSATVHVVTEADNDVMITNVKKLLSERYGINHATVQIETQHLQDGCCAG